MSVTSDIQQLYVAYFNRPADPVGLAYWTNVANANGGSTAAISAAFSASPEYTAAYAGLSPAEVVNAVYLNLFGRPAEPAGLTYWAPLIGNGKITISNVVTQIAAGAQGTDGVALANKVTAATAFTNAVDTSAEILGYTGAAANNVAKAYIAGVTNAASLTAQLSALDATVANTVAAHNGATTGNAVNLTIGLDNLTNGAGSAGNSVFSAQIVNNTNTFQSGDTLTATGNNNVLNVDLGNSANFAILATTTGIQTVNITAESQATIGTSAPGTNNLTGLPVQINALRMGNVTNWTDLQSRADVIIENISLPNGNVSKDVTNAVTFTMRDTQPGNLTVTGGGNNAASVGPSLRAYFNPQALKSATTGASSTVDVDIINSGTTYKDANPLASNLYSGFSLNVSTNGSAPVPVNFVFSAADVAAIKGATLANNQQVVDTAIINAVAAYNTANGTKYVATVSSQPWNLFNSADSTPEVGSPVTISLAGSSLTVNSWNITGGNTPPNYAIGNYMKPTPVAGSTSLITSNLIVDNVGQGGFPQFHNYSGSTEGAGGDIIIGSMATSGGVQQFNIDVQRTSWNDSVQTTNNVLQVVNIVSDAVVVPSKFDTITGGGQGYAIGAEIVPNVGNMINFAAPGTLVGTNGLRDVQTINSTGFNGSLEIGERIDYEAFGNYLSGATGVVPFSIILGDQSNGFIVPGNKAAFNSVNLSINSAVAGSGNFLETITGGTGNDIINVIVSGNNVLGNSATPSANGAWELAMTSLKNLVINTGAGDNTVMFVGGGAAQITSLAGNDAIYIDNTGGGGANLTTNIQGGAANLHAVWVSNAASATTSTVGAPTVVQLAAGTPGTFGTAQVSFVNVAPNTSAAAFSTVEDVAVNATNSGNVTAGNPAGDDLQGIQVIYNQAVAGPGVTTSTIATAVLNAYKDYIANHDPVTGLPNETAPTNTFGGGTITFKHADGTAAVPATPLATDVMVETFTISPGNTLQITIGNEYAVAQSATQSAQGIVGLTRTQVGPTSFAFDGQSAIGGAAYSAAPGDAPSANGTTTNGTASATESDNVTFKPLTGTGASETVAGITITNTEPTGNVTFTAAQVAAAVMAGNGTYGNLVVSGEGATTPAVNTGYRPVNEYTALTAAGGATPSEIVNGFTITNTGATALTAAQVAAAVATLGTATVTVTPAANATVSATDVVLNYDTPTAAPATPVVGSANGGVVQTAAGTQVSIDQYGNLTTFAPTQTGAAPYTFTGSGETVTVKYEGYSLTATITAANASAAATYTSADVNNAIAKAVNNDPTMSKLLHVTQGSANESIILNSLVDGRQTVPSITFAHPVGAGTGTATSLTGADGVALSQYTTILQASGDGLTTGTALTLLAGANSTLVNNSAITDTGSTATGYNVIDLSSNNAAVNGFAGGSANTVTLTGTGTTIITNYKLADTITTSATHAVILNAASNSSTPGVSAIFGADGSLKVSAASLGLASTAGVYEGSTFANATKVSGTAVTGPGLFILENATTKTTSVYYANDVSTINALTTVLEATLIGVTPPTTAITLV